MIPIIGTAVVNTPYWVYRLIKSIDYPVDKFIIINNNGRGQIDEELNNITLIFSSVQTNPIINTFILNCIDFNTVNLSYGIIYNRNRKYFYEKIEIFILK